MKKFSQGVLLLASVMLSAATYAASVQSCAYRRDMLPVRTYPLDFSCRSKSDFSAKAETNISLCMASAMKRSSQITWPAPAAIAAAQAQVADHVNAAVTASAASGQTQQLVVSCQLGRTAPQNPARGLLRATVQSSDRCLRDDIFV